MRGKSMKKAEHDELRPEYRREDLGKGVRGKYLKTYRAGTNLVLLDPKVAAAFPTERAVNEALSTLIEVAENADLTRRSTGRAKTVRR
ncbi:MAG: hypothetical protein AB1798_10435 [Spirochaetota bacterium]